MYRILIAIVAIAKMNDGIPLVNYQIYDPSTETETFDEQDFIGTEMFKIIDDTQGNSFDSMSPMLNLIEKRERHHNDPCGCPFKVRYESYGENAYPKYYKSKICDAVKIARKDYCSFGARCREFFYEVRYLVPKKNEIPEHVPSEINKLYGWVSKNISVDCRCLH